MTKDDRKVGWLRADRAELPVRKFTSGKGWVHCGSQLCGKRGKAEQVANEMPYLIAYDRSCLNRLLILQDGNSNTRENQKSINRGTQDTLQDSSTTLLSAITLTFLSSVFSRPKNLAISII